MKENPNSVCRTAKTDRFIWMELIPFDCGSQLIPLPTLKPFVTKKFKVCSFFLSVGHLYCVIFLGHFTAGGKCVFLLTRNNHSRLCVYFIFVNFWLQKLLGLGLTIYLDLKASFMQSGTLEFFFLVLIHIPDHSEGLRVDQLPGDVFLLQVQLVKIDPENGSKVRCQRNPC
jgi:hypothetical protein